MQRFVLFKARHVFIQQIPQEHVPLSLDAGPLHAYDIVHIIRTVLAELSSGSFAYCVYISKSTYVFVHWESIMLGSQMYKNSFFLFFVGSRYIPHVAG